MSDRPLQFASVRSWRAWLEENHDKAKEALLYITKKNAPGGIHYVEALEEALCFGWIDGKLRAHDETRFLLRFSPRKPDSVWSESNRQRAERLMRSGRMAPAGLAAIEVAKTRGNWARSRRPSHVPPVPSDLEEALRANPKAWTNFQAWGDSYRSACVRWVAGAKKPETRDKHIRRIVLRAAQNKRPGIEGF